MTNAKKDFEICLLEWFHENKREMPWRKTKDPYGIWVSEVMLQQTQVATVIPYYIKFMARFPTVMALAEATLEEVHTYWQGLGYYRRGENLWKGAKVIAERWQGVFPTDPKEVREIPGIGPYTLGAICSIAYNLPLPAVDGNVMRVISRWYMISEDIAVAKNRKIFEEKVMVHMPEEAGDFNQALMELGALICTPKKPNCEICPVQHLCKAHCCHQEEAFPVKLKKVKPMAESYYVLILEKEGKIGMLKRPSEGLLANLWGLPMMSEATWQKEGWDTLEGIELEQVTHVFTHRRWEMKPISLRQSVQVEQKLAKGELKEVVIHYFSEEELKKIPIATAFKKVLKKIHLLLR